VKRIFVGIFLFISISASAGSSGLNQIAKIYSSYFGQGPARCDVNYGCGDGRDGKYCMNAADINPPGCPIQCAFRRDGLPFNVGTNRADRHYVFVYQAFTIAGRKCGPASGRKVSRYPLTPDDGGGNSSGGCTDASGIPGHC
jgi:hypothetical protein